MGLLDDLEKRKDLKRENPLANLDIEKEKLDYTSIRVTGDTHAKLVGLYNVYLNQKSKTLIVDEAIDMLISKLSGEDKEVFEKSYEATLQQKIDIARRKGKY